LGSGSEALFFLFCDREIHNFAPVEAALSHRLEKLLLFRVRLVPDRPDLFDLGRATEPEPHMRSGSREVANAIGRVATPLILGAAPPGGYTVGGIGGDRGPMTVKDELKRMIETLPDDARFEDAIERLYLLYKIQRGEEQAERGEVLSQEEVEKRFEARWRK
jgi:predicted transcriptional regulator